jgi:hypothetical protein
MIVNQNGEPMPPLGDYRDSQISTLTRELADARAECEGVASEAAKMLTEYLETRDAAIARAEVAEAEAVTIANAWRTERDSIQREAETYAALLREAGEKIIGINIALDAFWNDPERPLTHTMRSKSVANLSDAQSACRSLAARIIAATQAETGGEDERN